MPFSRAQLDAYPAPRSFFDVPSVNPYLFGAKVLVNPVSIGSGVQLKMLDMLMTDVPIVTRSQGVRGLPPEVVSQFDVVDATEEFASAILRRLEAPAIDAVERQRRPRALHPGRRRGHALAGISSTAATDGQQPLSG